VLHDVRTAPIDERLRATLLFLEKLTLEPEQVGPGDIATLRSAGVSDAAIEDAVHVCALFNIYDRLADSLCFDVPDAREFEMAAGQMLRYGYD
jgi:alkylhydroperoxidase family enzyme